MLLTNHARERINDRTSLKPRFVLELIKEGATVSLGKTEKYEYLVFYSPFDGYCKIAVVSVDAQTIVTVWEKYYHLPKPIKRPTKSMLRKARRLYAEFAFACVQLERQKPKQAPKVPPRLYYTVRADVTEAGTTIFSQEVGEVTYWQGQDKGLCYQRCKQIFMQLASLAEKHKNKAKGIVQYHICLTPKVSTDTRKHYLIPHERIKRDIRKAKAAR
jgi:hypothetical protein